MRSILLAALLCPALLLSQTDAPKPYQADAKNVITTALGHGKAYDLLSELTSKVGPRLSGSAGAANAVAWSKGVMERLGVGYPAMSKVNPKLVFCSSSGYGQDGPYRLNPGHDVNYLAMAGALGLIGEPGRPPAIPLNLIAPFLNEAVVFSANELERAPREAQRVDGRLDLGVRGLGVPDPDVVAQRAGEQEALLRYHHDALAQGPTGRVAQRHAPVAHLTLERVVEARHELGERRLPGTRGPDQCDALARCDGDRDVVEHPGTEGVLHPVGVRRPPAVGERRCVDLERTSGREVHRTRTFRDGVRGVEEIGRASCRERV